jgi:hypothetical protein
MVALAALMLALAASPIQDPASQPPDTNYKWVYLGDPKLPETHTMFLELMNRRKPAKYSPKKFGGSDAEPYEFDWEIDGYGKHFNADTKMDLRFRIFSQERKESGDVAPMVAQMLLRLWDLDFKKFKNDHLELYRDLVDVYLCWGGAPGGEQRFDLDMDAETPPREVHADTIYIYDLSSFTNPMEMAREVAHEYGHAVLTPVGGFVTPEDWSNGQLGEKIFLRWCRDEMAAGRLQSSDVMGATLPMVDVWVKENVDPLVTSIAETGPQFGMLDGQGQASMDAFTGLVCYADALFGDQVAGLSLKLMPSSKAKDYPAALLQACQETQKVIVGVPAILKGKDFWVPLGKGKVTGATILKRSGDWAQIRPGVVATTLVYGG